MNEGVSAAHVMAPGTTVDDVTESGLKEMGTTRACIFSSGLASAGWK